MNYKTTGLGLACAFSLIYSVFFGLYVLGRAEIQTTRSIYVYLPAIIWGLVLLYLTISIFISKPFRCLFMAFGKILKTPITLISVFCKCCSFKNVVTFPTIWATEQVISLLIPITDALYSFIFYAQGIQRTRESSVLEATEILAFIIFSLRGMQCIVSIMKPMSKEEVDRKVSEFFILVRCLLNIMVTALSLSYQPEKPRIFVAWIILSVFTGLFNYKVDLFDDW